jgi:dCTP deaminase
MFLGDKAIREKIEEGTIRIDPFMEELLEPVNYDLRLGRYIYKPNGEYKLLDLEKVDFYLMPGEFILAHTEEFVGTQEFVGLINTTSTAARNGLDIHGSSSMVIPGSYNRITLEITNRSTKKPVKLERFTIIASISFVNVEGRTQKYSGSYNIESRKDWKPEMMIPKSLKIVRP